MNESLLPLPEPPPRTASLINRVIASSLRQRLRAGGEAEAEQDGEGQNSFHAGEDDRRGRQVATE